MWMRRVVGLGLGAVLGGTGGFLWMTLTEPESSAEPTPQLVCPDIQALSERTNEVVTELRTIEAQIQRLRWARAAAIGRQRMWPDDPPEPLREDVLRQHLERVLEAEETTLERLDCAAYPCVAILNMPVADEELELIEDDDGRANLSGALRAVIASGEYEVLPLHYSGRLSDDGETATYSVTWLSGEDYRSAKTESLESRQMDGTMFEAIAGRADALLEEWVSGGAK